MTNTKGTVLPRIVIKETEKRVTAKTTRGVKRYNGSMIVVKNGEIIRKRSSTSPARRVSRVIKCGVSAVSSWLYSLLTVIVYGVLYLYDAYNEMWQRFMDCCGAATRKMATQGLFGEAKDGYYLTDEGCFMELSAIKFDFLDEDME